MQHGAVHGLSVCYGFIFRSWNVNSYYASYTYQVTFSVTAYDCGMTSSEIEHSVSASEFPFAKCQCFPKVPAGHSKKLDVTDEYIVLEAHCHLQ